jgi:crossover junction endodeoxyribonuclease RuvC
MSCYIGFDPGKSGACAIIEHGIIVTVFPFPLAGKKIDASILSAKIIETRIDTRRILIACIEKVGAMPGQGVVGMFNFGYSTGLLYGICAGLGIAVHTVSPQTWKKFILKDTDKSKEATIEWCRNAYPNTWLMATPRSKKPHTGMADAIGIATYAYMMNL